MTMSVDDPYVIAKVPFVDRTRGDKHSSQCQYCYQVKVKVINHWHLQILCPISNIGLLSEIKALRELNAQPFMEAFCRSRHDHSNNVTIQNY